MNIIIPLFVIIGFLCLVIIKLIRINNNLHKKLNDKFIKIKDSPELTIAGSREYIKDEVIPEIIGVLEKGRKLVEEK